MKIDPNDPRLTAYALGELADSDRIAFEAELTGDPETRQEIDRIRGAAVILKAKLEVEPCPRLEPAQRLVIQEQIAPVEKEANIGFRWWMGLLAGAATLVLVGALMLPALSRAHSKARTLVLNTPTTAILLKAKAEDDPAPFAALRDFNYTGPTLSGRSAGSGFGIKGGGDISTAGGTPPVAIAPAAPASVDKSVDGVAVSGAGSTWAAALSANKEAIDLAKNDNNVFLLSGGALHKQTSRDTLGVGGLSKQASDATGFVVGNNSSVAGAINGASSVQNTLTLGDTGVGQLGIGGAGSAGNVLTINGGIVNRGNEIVNIGGLAQNFSGGQAARTGKRLVNNSVVVMGGGSGWNAGGQIAQVTDGRSDSGGRLAITKAGKFYSGNLELGNNGRLFSPSDETAARAQVLGNLNAWSTVTPGTESYTPVYDNPFYAVTDQPLSTFGLDVDTASYANIRRFLLNDQLPPRDAVRIEEMLNYFSYNYPTPHGSDPFALYVEMGECPWNPAHQLALVGLKAKDVTPRQQPPLNLVFLIDISGSMGDPGKLALIKQAFRLLVPHLSARDRVSIVVYADNSRVLLPSTRGDEHAMILLAIDSLNASGSTNGGEGIQSAYREATANFIKDGINRVILCTDGDFNLGITDPNELVRLIEQKAQSGVFLNVFGFGMGNLQDSTMQKLADKGNGQYAYIDDLEEARKVLVDQARATLITVAKDVKLQVEFNPAHVQAYRLIGYEKRALAAHDFNNDRKDAGEIGAGHTVTALYEIVPVGGVSGEPGVDPLKYQPAKNRPAIAVGAEWATVKLRFKEPNADTSQLLTAALKNRQLQWRTASDDFQFAAAVATFGMVLRDSPSKADANLGLAYELAEAGRGRDAKGYRSEFIDLVKRAGQRAR